MLLHMFLQVSFLSIAPGAKLSFIGLNILMNSHMIEKVPSSLELFVTILKLANIDELSISFLISSMNKMHHYNSTRLTNFKIC